jgi:Kef-type K+ transport systems, membrane components
MDNSNLMMFFIQLSYLLVVALLFGKIMRLFGQPAILGEIIGGIILGPTVMGTFSPYIYSLFFSELKPITPQLDSFIQFGMLIFMFVKGLEIDFGIIKKRVKCVALTSIMGIIVPFSFGVLSTLFIPFIQGDYISQSPKIIPIFIGTALSISALPIILRILEDLKINKAEIGVIIVICAAISDLVGWTVFSCITSSLMYPASIKNICISILKVIMFLVIVLCIIPQISKKLNKYSSKLNNMYLGITVLSVLLIAILGESFGLHPFFSAFILGISLRKIFNTNERNVHETLNILAMNFFAPIYFASIGLKVNFAKFFDMKLVLTIILIAYIGKIIGTSLGALIGGMKAKQAFSIGVIMNARGAVEIILASTALEFKIIDNRIFVALVIMAIVTSLTSAPLFKCINKRSRGDFKVNLVNDKD